MNVDKTGSQAIQYRYDAEAVTQKKKTEQVQQDKEKQTQVAASETQRTNEEKLGSTLKSGAINLTA
jgi:uncharacterized FlaG/YvyC family protein